jgi:hypothetical protein
VDFAHPMVSHLVRYSDLGALDIDFGLRDREASVTQAARENACSSKDILLLKSNMGVDGKSGPPASSAGSKSGIAVTNSRHHKDELHPMRTQTTSKLSLARPKTLDSKWQRWRDSPNGQGSRST